MHLYNGLYVDILVTRLINRLWPIRRESASVPA
jgi:NAD(P)H-quinone oxidoreductase subunit 5